MQKEGDGRREGRPDHNWLLPTTEKPIAMSPPCAALLFYSRGGGGVGGGEDAVLRL